jgi:hypothetical protein
MAQGFEAIRDGVSGVKDLKGLVALLEKNGVVDTVAWMKSAAHAYAYNRVYRADRNQSMKALKAEVAKLREQVGK